MELYFLIKLCLKLNLTKFNSILFEINYTFIYFYESFPIFFLILLVAIKEFSFINI